MLLPQEAHFSLWFILHILRIEDFFSHVSLQWIFAAAVLLGSFWSRGSTGIAWASKRPNSCVSSSTAPWQVQSRSRRPTTTKWRPAGEATGLFLFAGICIKTKRILSEHLLCLLRNGWITNMSVAILRHNHHENCAKNMTGLFIYPQLNADLEYDVYCYDAKGEPQELVSGATKYSDT